METSQGCNNHHIIEDISFRESFFSRFKVYNFFCLNCDYEKKKEIKISAVDYLNSILDRTIKIQNTKTLTTDKTYNQNYQKVKGAKK